MSTCTTARGRKRTHGVAMTTNNNRRKIRIPRPSSAGTLAVLLIVSSCCSRQHHGKMQGTALHAGGIWGTVMTMLPVLTAVAAEEQQMPVVDSYQGEMVDPVELGAHHDDEEEQHMSPLAAAADIGTRSDDTAEAAVPPAQEEQVGLEKARSSEEAEDPTANKAREESHSTQPLHHKDNEATVSSKKKGVPFGGFAGTAAAAATADTNTSATTVATKTSPSKNDNIIPPDGFVLASRIVSIEGLSYFVDSVGVGASTESDANAAGALSPPPVFGDLTIPFLDCGAVGSFTDAIDMRDCSFRHLPSGAEPFGWATVDAPQLVVALQPLEVTVSGGGGDDGLESTLRNFRAGDVLLFEDTDGKGHKMKAAPIKKKGATGGKPAATPILHPDMSVLIISLPPQKRHGNHHRAGTGATSGSSGSKDKTAIRLPALFGRRNSHNNEGGSVDGDPPRPCLVETDGTYSSLGPPASQTLSDVLPSPGRLIRGAVGAVLSALMTDRWLGRGQPRISGWLGGCALVVGGTCGVAAVGEGTLESLADWWEEFVISRRFMDGEDVVEDVGNNDNEDLDLDGLKEEIKEEILPQMLAGRNSSEKL